MRTTITLLSIVLLLGFTQCKKKEVVSTTNTNYGPHITLTADYGQKGEKSGFNPSTHEFVWTNGATEYLYVGGSEHTGCLGVLSGTGTGTGSMTFSGDLTVTPDEGETLHFFYLGKGRTGNPISSLDFSSQDGTLENVTNFHIAIGDGSYSSSTVSYATTLDMKMAIAYFDVSGFVNSSSVAETVYLHGEDVYSTANIDYQNGAIVGDKKGLIDMGTANAGKYIALIPSVSTETWLRFDSGSKKGDMKFLRGIQEAKYYAHSGEALNVTANNITEGSLTGVFSVSATDKVRFSKGNLCYYCSTTNPEWKFADNQYDHIYYNADDYGVNTEKWIDNFGWGTSGYNHRTLYFQPWSNAGSWDVYTAYNDQNKSLYNGDGTADWGYNAISNGGNAENNGWRALTGDEWQYLMFTRSTSTVANTYNARFARAYLFGTKHGIILFPDNYTHPAGVNPPDYINVTSGEGYNSNQYSVEDWNKMEAAGCVFLPKSYAANSHISKYWSSQHKDNVNAFTLYWHNTGISQYYFVKSDRCAVRLVIDR